MKKQIKGKFLIVALACIAFFAMASMASAEVDSVRCILWQGDTAKYHTAIDSQSVRLKGVITATDANQIWYKWVFGDGSESAVTLLSGLTKYNVNADHVYTGAVGTPFTAQLQVDDVDNSMANAVVDNYLVKIEENNLEARVNIAIDNGLWWLYKNNYTHSYMHTFDGSPFIAWRQTSYGTYLASPTASAIQAFAINNHKINGDPDEDPYVTPVQLGMNWLIQGYYRYTSRPMLQALSVSIQHGDDPDTNGNGYGIEVRDYSYRPIYEGGQIMDAIIASGVQPGEDTGRDFTSRGSNWTFGELLQDMCDMYAYGQCDSSNGAGSYYGGWRYSWGNWPDNSAAQWAAIGMIPAQEAPWNCSIPSWVKTYNNTWLHYSHRSWTTGGVNYGGFGYKSSGAGWGTTPSGLVQMAFDGLVGYDDPATPGDDRDARWVRTERYFADYWGSFLSGTQTYGWYAFAKAMRLAVPEPVERFVSNNFDWYNGSAGITGLAKHIVNRQASSGYWGGNYTNTPLTTAWMIITLRPALFKAAPIACFTAHPNPAYPDMDIIFDPLCSDHSETGKDITNLTLFEWDWDNDGVYDESTSTPEEMIHAFPCTSLPCTYPVTLRVTDDDPEELTATYTLDIRITNPPHPPVADADGPYMVSLCDGDTLTLDGTGSFDPNEGQHEAGCSTCPDDTIIVWNWDLTSPLTGFDDESGETVALDSSAIASYFSAGSHNIGLQVADNTVLSYPSSGEPNLTDADFGTVRVYDACACDLAARPKSGKVQLTWAHTGAASYDIYRSTEGPNTGFALIADDHVTTYATYLDYDVVNGTAYYYRVVSSDGCGSKAVSATPQARTRR